MTLQLSIHPIVATVLLSLLTACSCAIKTMPTLALDQVPIDVNSNRVTITTDLSKWSPSVGSWVLMCQVTDITIERGSKYYTISDRAQSNGVSSFRLSFYDSLPDGLKPYPKPGTSIFAPNQSIDLNADPDTMAIDAKKYKEACNVFYQKIMSK